MKNNKKLILIDGSSYLFRAFHALPPLTNSKGTPTGAVYGVINMLKKIINDEKPDYIACVFDTKEKTFRHDLYKEYKANRPDMPEELAVQIEPLFKIIEGMGVPLIKKPGFEADDIIGTLAIDAANNDLDILISTGDKDFAQLVSDQITLVNTMSGKVMDKEGVVEKFGVGPDLIIDYLALIGDTVDNVPGVAKVGPKTAVKWLNEHGNLASIIENQEKIKGKVGENLRSVAKDLPLSKELVTIKLDVPLDFKYSDLEPKPQDTNKLRDLFTKLEFKTWLKDLDKNNKEDNSKTKTRDYHTIFTKADFNNLIDKLKQAKIFAFDTETTSLNAMQAELVGVSFGLKDKQAYYIPLKHNYENCPEQLDFEFVINELKKLFADHKLKIIGQHLKYDMHVCHSYGINIKPGGDSMLASYVLNSTATRHDLDSLADKYLDETTISYTDLCGKGVKAIPFSQVDIHQASEYASEDADITFRLHELLTDELKNIPALEKVYTDIELPLIKVLWQMEQTGVKIDEAKLTKQSGDISKTLEKLEEQAFTLAGEEFNLASPKQLQEILYDKLNLPVLAYTPKGAPSTAESVLQDLSNDFELPKIILEARSLSKLKSTYTDQLPRQINPKTGRVHTSYHQANTATGRLSSSDPNLQNIPIRTDEGRKIRQAFICDPGKLIVAADYSQIELRIMAHLSDDPNLLAAFQNDQDIHSFTASEVFGVDLDKVTSLMRRRAKAINFGLIYGMGAFGLAKQIEVDQKAAKQYIEKYFERYPGVKNYMDNTRKLAAKQGYVETLYGRRLYLPEINSRNFARRAASERTAINAPMQGTAADLIKRAMLEVSKQLVPLKDKAKMIMQVHDELVFEVEKSCLEQVTGIIKAAMQGAGDLKVPLLVSVGVGDNWDKAH